MAVLADRGPTHLAADYIIADCDLIKPGEVGEEIPFLQLGVEKFGRDLNGGLVDYGSHVTSGSLLAKIDDVTYQSAVMTANAALHSAQASLEQVLWSKAAKVPLNTYSHVRTVMDSLGELSYRNLDYFMARRNDVNEQTPESERAAKDRDFAAEMEQVFDIAQALLGTPSGLRTISLAASLIDYGKVLPGDHQINGEDLSGDLLSQFPLYGSFALSDTTNLLYDIIQ